MQKEQHHYGTSAHGHLWIMELDKICWGILLPGIFSPPIMRQVYNEDGTFQLYKNDTLKASTTFTIRREMTGWAPDTANVIHFKDSIQFQTQMFTINSDSLILHDLCMDCFTHFYKRIQ